LDLKCFLWSGSRLFYPWIISSLNSCIFAQYSGLLLFHLGSTFGNWPNVGQCEELAWSPTQQGVVFSRWSRLLFWSSFFLPLQIGYS
jgi:hypothetical protein